jgi:protein-disulfide isomerase
MPTSSAILRRRMKDGDTKVLNHTSFYFACCLSDLWSSLQRLEAQTLNVKSSTGAAILILALLFASFLPSRATAQNSTVSAFLEGLGSEPMLGSPSAPVWIVEFSDFQCGYCRKFWKDTLPKLKESYISKGAVRFTYRHFAVLGKPSEQAALAAECAAAQKKFWPYHDKLFSSLGEALFNEANLKRFAREVGLDGDQFGACLGAGKYKEKIERETATATYLGGRGTPLFFINQKFLPGAQPYSLFQKLIEEELTAMKTKR